MRGQRNLWKVVGLSVAVALVPAGFAHAQDAEVALLFPSLDANRDGQIDRAEVSASMLTTYSAMQKGYDKNGDGIITLEECSLDRAKYTLQNPAPTANAPAANAPAANVPPVTQNAPPAAASRADELFTLLDADGDGKLSRLEGGAPLAAVFARLNVSVIDRATFRSLQGSGGNPGPARGAGNAVRPALPRPNVEQQPLPLTNIAPTAPRAGQAARLGIMSLDSDGNGKLSVTELSLLMLRLPLLDADRDGELDLNEIIGNTPAQAPAPAAAPDTVLGNGDAVNAPQPVGEQPAMNPVQPANPAENPPAPAPVQLAPVQPPVAVSGAFLQLDTNSDGVIDRDEMPDFMEATTFQSMDSDGDGRITREEYATFISRSLRGAGPEAKP